LTSAAPVRIAVAAAAVLASALGVAALATADPSTPEATGVAASGAMSLGASDGDSILSARHMLPGGEATGTVTIRNTGDSAGTLALVRDALVDAPGPNGGRLAGALQLRVEEVVAGVDTPLFSGPLSELASLPVGPVAVGGARTFRLTARWPDGGTPAGPASGDNALQGASVRVDYAWVTEAVPSIVTPTPTPPPATPATPARPAPTTTAPTTTAPITGSPSPAAATDASPSTSDRVEVLPEVVRSGVRVRLGQVGLSSRGRVNVTVTCPSACGARISGRLDDGSPRRAPVLRRSGVLRGERLTRSIGAQRPVRLTLSLTPRARALLGRQVRRRGRVGLTIRVRARAGGRTTTTVRRITQRARR
jgi:hypothetical protein